jgi:hypothetical protein
VADYARHEPEKTLLHEVVREQPEGFLAGASARDRPVPRFVEQELRAFLRCGVLAHGFLRLHCDDCGHDRLVAFSCKRRGFCPSCRGRRMADTAAHLVDRVLPEVPIRQWVLTLPYPLRYRCAYDARLTSEVLRAFLRALFSELRRRARLHWSVSPEQCGAVTFIQRFGSALDLNLHFHTLALDGVYTGGYGEPLRFLPLPPPGPDEVARVLAGTARRIERLLAGGIDDDDALARDEPLLALSAAASMRRRTATGAQQGARWRRLGDRIEPQDAEASDEHDPEASPRVPRHGGMSLHADVAVPARDRRRLERLVRYVARPPLAGDRLEALPDGMLALRLKTRWRDGTTHILMERRELLERLVPLIPPPRAHQVRYHGILAPGASMRDRIVPAAPPPAERAVAIEAFPATPDAAERETPLAPAPVPVAPSEQQAGREPPPAPPAGPPIGAPVTHRAEEGASPARMCWAALLQRVFAVDALRCPHCGATMRVIAAIEDPLIAHKVLACLGLPARAPPVASAGGESLPSDPPYDEWGFDQSIIYDDA